MEEFYQLRMHLTLMQQRLRDVRERGDEGSETTIF